MTVLENKNLEVVTLYKNGKYQTVKKDSLMYLVKGSSKESLEIIASITLSKDMVIFNRDLLNCFLSEVGQDKRNLERVSDPKAITSTLALLNGDLEKMIAFDKTEISGDFKRIIDGFTPENQEKVFKALENLGVYQNGQLTAVYKELTTSVQMKWAKAKLYPFAKLDKSSNHFDICSRTSDGGYVIAGKNGGAGSFRAIEEDKENRIMVIFNKEVQPPKAEPTIQNNAIREKVLKDLKGTAYAAANQFVKIEEQITKAYEKLIEEDNDKQGFSDTTKFVYPDIDEETSMIAKTVRKYQKEKNNQDIDTLVNLYNSAYAKLETSSNALKELVKA